MSAGAPDSGTPVPGSTALSTTVLNGGSWLGIAALVQAVLQIAIFAALARLLSPAEFGLVAIAGIVIDLASGVAAMGTSQALIQRPVLTKHHIRAAFWISIVMGALATTVLFVSAPWLGRFLGNVDSGPLIAALSFTFVIRSLALVAEGLAARDLMFRILAIRQLVAYIVGYGVIGIGTALNGAGAWALVYAQLGQVSIASLLLIAAVRFSFWPTVEWAAHRDILSFGSGFSVARIANSLANQVDRAVVSINAGTAAVGIYTRALQTARYPTTLVGQVVEDVLFPSLAGVQKDRARLNAAYSRAVGASLVVLAPLAVLFCACAEPITDILLGDQWGAAVPLLVVFGSVIPARTAQRITSAALRAVGRSWLIASLQIFLLLTTGVGALFGVQYGMLGAAVGVTVAFIVHYFVLMIAGCVVLRVSAIDLLARHCTGIPLALVVGATAFGALTLFRSQSSIVTLLVTFSMSAFMAFVAVWLLPRVFLQADGQWLVSILKSRIPARVLSIPLLSAFVRRITK